MKKIFLAGLCLAMSLGLGLKPSQAADKKELEVGDAAPDFELTGSDGKVYKLSDFKGKQAVVIAWYPKAFTGG